MQLNHINAVELKFIPNSCDLCGSNDSTLICSVSFLSRDFSFVRCSNCDLIYQNPLLDQKSRAQIYQSIEYWNHKKAPNSNSTMLNYYSYISETHHREKTNRLKIEWIRRHLPVNSRVLDLGCSDGLFVHALRNAGYQAQGMDISLPMLRHGKSAYDVKLIQGDMESGWPFKKSFDAITCFATFSNFIKPSLVFKNVQENLRTGGLFFFNFGDSDRIVSRLLGSQLYLYRPTVAVIYSKNTVMKYCQENSFQIKQLMNDVQYVPFARILGFLKTPAFTRIVKYFNLEDAHLKLSLPTGYMACAEVSQQDPETGCPSMH